MGTKIEAPEVKPGQIWADLDKRATGRTIRVEAIEDGKAVCTVLTNSASAQKDIDEYKSRTGSDGGSPWCQDTRGKTVRVSVARMRPVSNGYRLVTAKETAQ